MLKLSCRLLFPFSSFDGVLLLSHGYSIHMKEANVIYHKHFNGSELNVLGIAGISKRLRNPEKNLLLIFEAFGHHNGREAFSGASYCSM